MHRSKLILACIAVGIALTLGYLVGKSHVHEGPTAPVVRSYQVPVDRAGDVRNALNNLFWRGKDDENLGHAQLFSGGLLLVRAPEEIQTGVAQLIRQLAAEKAPARNKIRVDFWLVIGEEAPSSNHQNFAGLSTVLSSLAKVDGPRRFRVLEHLAANPLDEQKVMLKGSIVSAKFTADLAGSHLNVSADVSSAFGQIETNTRLDSGEYIVLGENSIKPRDVRLHDDERFKGEPDDKQVNVYHILRAELVK